MCVWVGSHPGPPGRSEKPMMIRALWLVVAGCGGTARHCTALHATARHGLHCAGETGRKLFHGGVPLRSSSSRVLAWRGEASGWGDDSDTAARREFPLTPSVGRSSARGGSPPSPVPYLWEDCGGAVRGVGVWRHWPDGHLPSHHEHSKWA